MTFNCRFCFFSLPAKCHLAAMPGAEKNWVGHHPQILIPLSATEHKPLPPGLLVILCSKNKRGLCQCHDN